MAGCLACVLACLQTCHAVHALLGSSRWLQPCLWAAPRRCCLQELLLTMLIVIVSMYRVTCTVSRGVQLVCGTL
jgi:hypothetical protein